MSSQGGYLVDAEVWNGIRIFSRDKGRNKQPSKVERIPFFVCAKAARASATKNSGFDTRERELTRLTICIKGKATSQPLLAQKSEGQEKMNLYFVDSSCGEGRGGENTGESIDGYLGGICWISGEKSGVV